MKGCYILLIELNKDKIIDIGKLGSIFFKKGYYIYVGSAQNSIENRINRHKRTEKKLHWHIDYLLQFAKIKEAYYRKTKENEECLIAKSFSKLEQIKGFGCSDCKCSSHLFYSDLRDINNLILKLELKRFKI